MSARLCPYQVEKLTILLRLSSWIWGGDPPGRGVARNFIWGV